MIEKKWHVKPDGTVGKCSASVRACRYSSSKPGSPESHFASRAEAEAAAAKRMDGLLTSPMTKPRVNTAVDNIVKAGKLTTKYADAVKKLAGTEGVAVDVYSSAAPDKGFSSVDFVAEEELTLPPGIQKFLAERDND